MLSSDLEASVDGPSHIFTSLGDLPWDATLNCVVQLPKYFKKFLRTRGQKHVATRGLDRTRAAEAHFKESIGFLSG